MSRRIFLAGAGAVALASGLRAFGQEKVFRIGHLTALTEAANRAHLDAFRQGMKERGLVEGRHYTIESRYADGKGERLPSLVQELLQRKPDVLLVATTPGNLAVKAAKTAVPVVFVLVADPVGAGIVPTLARQQVNVTGVTNLVAELGGKRLQILKEIFPKASRFAVIVNPTDQNTPLQIRYAEEGARALGVKLDPVLEVRNVAELEASFARAAKEGAPAALRMIDPLALIHRRQSAEWAAKNRMPVMFPLREDVEEGGLISYGSSAPDQFRQSAQMVEKILRGASASSIPVEQPTKFDLAVNLKSAKALGVTIPEAILVRADKVIE